MKQIILPTDDHSTVTVTQAMDAFVRDPEVIIAYETQGRNGLGILIRKNGRTGFVYHSKLIRGDLSDMKFQGISPGEAVRRVLKADRVVHIFDNFAEFAHYAGNMDTITY